MKKDFIVRRSITMVEGKPHVETYSEQELVRCKDCIFPKNGICHNAKTFGAIVKDNWFCADGKRRTNDA